MATQGARNIWFVVFFLMMCMTHVKSSFYAPDCKTEGLSCINCTHRKMCVRWIPFFGPIVPHGDPKPCSDSLTGHSLKYCDPGTNQCVANAPEQCQEEGNLSCLRKDEGNYYPNINDCKKFYKCDKESPKVEECPTGQVYKHEWRKCVTNLDTNSDCFEVTKCPKDSHNYPGDLSLYYKCSQGSNEVSLSACPSSQDVYNPLTGICESNQLCGLTPSKLLVPIPYKCSSYFDCATNKEIQCPNGQGFNQNTQKCTLFYNRLCNEFGLLENNIKSLLGWFFPIQIIENILSMANLNPYSFILLLPLPESIVSTSILAIDYLLKERSIPPGLINYIVEFGLSLIPPPIRAILDMLLNFLPIKLPSKTNLSRDQAIALAVEREFAKTNFSEVAQSIQAVETFPSGFKIFIKHVSERLNIPQENLYGILRIVTPTLAQTVNKVFGKNNREILFLSNDVLYLEMEGLIEIKDGYVETIENFLKVINVYLAETFKNIVKTYDYDTYYFIKNLVHNVYFPLHA